MSVTTHISTLIRTVINDQVLMLYPGESLIMRAGMVSEAPYSPIYYMPDLKAQRGQKITIPLLKALGGAGVAGNSTLTGSEQAMQYSSTDVTISVARQGIILEGRLTEQEMACSMRDDMAPQLASWIAQEKDRRFFAAMHVSSYAYDTTTNAPHTPHACVFGGDADSWDNLSEGDKLDTNVLRRCARLAQKRGIHAIRVPGVGTISGVLIITPAQAYDLQSDNAWIEAQKHAMPAGITNPLFTNALGMFANVLVVVDFHDPAMQGHSDFSNELVNSSLLYQDTANGTFDKVESIFLGARACAYAEVVGAEVNPNDTTDYNYKYGLGVMDMCGFAKLTINMGTTAAPKNRDYGTMYVLTSATKL